MQTKKFITDCSGKSVIGKDPDSRRLYGINLRRVLAAQAATIASAEIIEIVGVVPEMPNAPIIQAPYIMAWTTGGDAQLGLNSFTIRFTLSDGTEDDKTLYFNIEQN